ncbi:MAG TPA: hypothetical protein VGI86_09170 [Acidimicrobiia bacterium]|jgi:hypothetical protein
MSDAATSDAPLSDAPGPRSVRGTAKRALAPLERRIEIAVTRAVEATIRREIAELQAAMRADIATLVELTYELEHLAGRIDTAVRALAPVSADDDA